MIGEDLVEVGLVLVVVDLCEEVVVDLCEEIVVDLCEEVIEDLGMIEAQMLEAEDELVLEMVGREVFGEIEEVVMVEVEVLLVVLGMDFEAVDGIRDLVELEMLGIRF